MNQGTPGRNLITITFVSLKQSCFIEAEKNFIFVFLQLFEHTVSEEDACAEINPIQPNSQALKQKIFGFIDIHGKRFPALNGFRTFLTLLPEDHSFIIIHGKLTDTQKTLKYFAFLTRYHNERGKPQKIDERFFDWGNALELYNMRNFGHQRRSIGLNIRKQDRTCRFCGATTGEINSFGAKVSFRNKSHAFSEALGNKNVICLDECDACNDRFSTSCELSLINLLSLFRSLHGLQGKGGKKTLTGKNFVLDPQKGLDIKYDGTIDPSEKIDKLEICLELKESVIPQDVYRCLVKFILSVTDHDELEFMDQTIRWVNGEFSAEKLPKIAFLQAGNFYKESPMLNYYYRKVEGKMPYMIGEFHYADMVYVFIIPFCAKDNQDFTDEVVFEDFWSKFNIRTHYAWSMKDFSSYKPINMHVNVSVEGIAVGENAFIKVIEE